MELPKRMRAGLAAVLCLPGLLLGCAEAIGGPDGSADIRLRLQVSVESDARLAAMGLVIDRVEVTVWALPADTVVDTSAPITTDQQTVDLPVALSVSGDEQDFGISVRFLAGGTLLFQGGDTITIASGVGTVDIEIPFAFVGPGDDIAFMFVRPSDTTVTFADQIQMEVDAFDQNENVVDPFFVSWSVDEPSASIDAAGVLTAGNTRTQANVIAEAPNGVVDTATVTFQPPPSSVEAASGDGVTAATGTDVDLVARVLGSDGMPLAGVPVTFSATAGGGSVDPAAGVSDASGLVGTNATLGASPGTQTFEAAVNGLPPAVFTITAIQQEPAITLSPGSLTFDATEGGNPSPATRTVTVSNTGTDVLNWTASDDQSWMSVSPGSGALQPGQSANLSVTVASSSLAPATYAGTVTVSDPAAANSPQTVSVTLTVSPPGAAIGLSPDTLQFSVVQGSNPSNGSISLTNVGGQSMTWTATDSQSWLTLSPTSGSLGAEQGTTLTASVASASLPAGTYLATVTVNSPEAVNAPRTMTVRLVVSPPPATITLTPRTLSFSAQQGSNPSAQSIQIRNSGGSTLSWTGTDNQSWLALASGSGSVAPGSSTSVAVNVTSASLAPGTYNATITISDASATNSPQTASVTLTVTPGPPTISLSSDTLFFSAQAGVNPSAQSISIGNTGGQTLNWTGTDDQSWLALGQGSGSVAPGSSQTVQVNVTSDALNPGTYDATITIRDGAATNSPQTKPVRLTVTQAPSISISRSSLFFTAPEGVAPFEPTDTFSVTNTGGGDLVFSASSKNGVWADVSPTSGSALAGESEEGLTVTASNPELSPGIHTDSIQISDPSASNSPQWLPLTLEVTAETPVIFNLEDALVTPLDVVHCTVGTVIGDRYAYTFDYTDDDGDGDLGFIEAIVEFDTIGVDEVPGPAVYEPSPPFFDESTDGFSGTVVWDFCVAFLQESSTVLEFWMTDGGGHASDTVSILTVFDPGPSFSDEAPPVASSTTVRSGGAAEAEGRARVRIRSRPRRP